METTTTPNANEELGSYTPEARAETRRENLKQPWSWIYLISVLTETLHRA